MTLTLSDLLVVSLEQAVAAPMCSCRLADAGARVIKVERPEGDFARGYDKLAHGESAYFVWLNRGKESVVLDLTKADDKALLDKLLAKAESGLASVTGGPEAPARVGVSVTDVAAGMNAYEAVLEAIIARGRSGQGAAISVSLFDAMADWMTVPLLHHEGGKSPQRLGLSHPSIAPYGVFKTRDSADILISIQNDREWRILASQVMGDAALAADPLFATNAERMTRRAETDGKVAAVFGAMDVKTLSEKLAAADIAFAR